MLAGLFHSALDHMSMRALNGATADHQPPRAELQAIHPFLIVAVVWDKYSPNLRVCIQFALIGVFATIAIYIFGRMAKRWKGMNA